MPLRHPHHAICIVLEMCSSSLDNDWRTNKNRQEDLQNVDFIQKVNEIKTPLRLVEKAEDGHFRAGRKKESRNSLRKSLFSC